MDVKAPPTAAAWRAPARGAAPGGRRGPARLFPWLLLLALASSGCFIGTVARLLQTRGQLLKFDEKVVYEASDSLRGPGLRFLEPKLTRDDIRVIASGREPSKVDSVDGVERWTFRWHRRPPQRHTAIHLQLDFRDDRLERLEIDQRFARLLGDERIHMLVRNFTGGDTDLDLRSKRILCPVPAEELAPFDPIDVALIRDVFGRENYRRSDPRLPENEIKLVFRYRLAGATGKKATMSFGATIDQASGRLGRITSSIGSFRLEFDLTAQP